MIRPDIFSEISFERYANMVGKILQIAEVDMVVVDDSGHLVWKNHDVNDEIDNLSRSIHLFGKNSVADNDSCRLLSGSGNKVFAWCSLGQISGSRIGNAVFSIDRAGSVDELSTSRIRDVLDDVAQLMRNELRYLYEVNSLAIELGDRYDELAMLRSTEGFSSGLRESRHILSSYVRKYAEHVDIDYACIWIPSRQYFFPAGRLYSPKDAACERTLHEVAACAYSLISHGLEAVAINNNRDPLLNHSELDINQKILAVPVRNGTNEVCGILVSLNAWSKRDFTYSDRMTVESVCKKIYKYLDSTEDPLTQLYNKVGFEESVWRDVRLGSSQAHLALINLRQFNVINGAYGTHVGDQVLMQVGRQIAERIQGRGFAARIEADHFAVLISQGDTNSVEGLMRDIIQSVSEHPYQCENKNFCVSAHCSVVRVDDDKMLLSECIYLAQLALETASGKCGNDVVIYQPGNTELVKRKKQMSMVGNIRHALEENRFILYAQNIRALKGGFDHYEILVRMLDENGDIVPPNDFIPVAERYRLMPLVDKWVLHQTLKTLDQYGVYHTHPDIKWGVNLSGDSMSDKGFLDYVSKTMHSTPVPATSLYFEITETAVIENYQNFVALMNQIHSLGCQFALDDFGSGLCSFSYLKKLKVDYLKIDGSLVRDIADSDLDFTIVASVSAIANVMDVKTIAEYVENDQIIGVLNPLNIDYAQGFGIMKPMPLDEVIEQMQHKEPPLKESRM